MHINNVPKYKVIHNEVISHTSQKSGLINVLFHNDLTTESIISSNISVSSSAQTARRMTRRFHGTRSCRQIHISTAARTRCTPAQGKRTTFARSKQPWQPSSRHHTCSRRLRQSKLLAQRASGSSYTLPQLLFYHARAPVNARAGLCRVHDVVGAHVDSLIHSHQPYLPTRDIGTGARARNVSIEKITISAHLWTSRQERYALAAVFVKRLVERVAKFKGFNEARRGKTRVNVLYCAMPSARCYFLSNREFEPRYYNRTRRERRSNTSLAPIRTTLSTSPQHVSTAHARTQVNRI